MAASCKALRLRDGAFSRHGEDLAAMQLIAAFLALGPGQEFVDSHPVIGSFIHNGNCITSSTPGKNSDEHAGNAPTRHRGEELPDGAAVHQLTQYTYFTERPPDDTNRKSFSAQ